ncbi:MAG: DUF4194 domain-containing protein [Burkholderiaceae bacterium]|jgi:hypothetical protein|nr:DUF4194 domain-containing protein [Burkholderiaceae bacterium]
MSNSLIDPADSLTAAVPSLEAHVEGGASVNGTFAGDTGQLPLETRRVLVQLLLGPSIDATRQRHLWPVLLRDEAVLRSRLHDLFLELVVDTDQQVAFTRQVVAEDIDAPVLLRKAHLTFLETALVLFLRQRLTQADAAGERAVVSYEDMQAHLGVFERVANADQARFGRQVVGAIEKVKKLSLVRLLPGGQQRFEVSPTLKLLFPAEAIQALTQTYQALLNGGAQPSSAVEADDDDQEGIEP